VNMSAARSRPTQEPEHTDEPCPHCGVEGGSCADAPAATPDASESARTPQDQIAQLERSLADAQEQRLRLIAEYQTSQRRALESEVRARGAGVAHMARQIIPVVDNLDLALGQIVGMSAEKAIEGLTMLRAELGKALEKSGIERIEPKSGEEFDPHQHEAVMRQPADGVDRDHISMIFQPGYRLGETVIRPAKVAVAP